MPLFAKRNAADVPRTAALVAARLAEIEAELPALRQHADDTALTVIEAADEDQDAAEAAALAAAEAVRRAELHIALLRSAHTQKAASEAAEAAARIAEATRYRRLKEQAAVDDLQRDLIRQSEAFGRQLQDLANRYTRMRNIANAIDEATFDPEGGMYDSERLGYRRSTPPLPLAALVYAELARMLPDLFHTGEAADKPLPEVLADLALSIPPEPMPADDTPTAPPVQPPPVTVRERQPNERPVHPEPRNHAEWKHWQTAEGQADYRKAFAAANNIPEEPERPDDWYLSPMQLAIKAQTAGQPPRGSIE